jgi:hypothetical protein
MASIWSGSQAAPTVPRAVASLFLLYGPADVALTAD